MSNGTQADNVSVIIPAFNAALTIERAIKSVLIQKYILEILIIDDCSVDETVAIVVQLAKYAEKVKLLRHYTNKGASAARNTGIANAKGDFIAFLDADDVWLEGKIQKQLKGIVGNPDVKLVTCDAYQMNACGEILKRAHENRIPREGREAWKTLLCYNFIPTPTVLARKKDIVEAGCFSELLPVAEDLDLWIRLAMKGGVAIVPYVLVHYYDYAGSLMKIGGAGSETLIMNMIESHIDIANSRLTGIEINRIRGVRNFNFGIDRYFTGSPDKAIHFFYLAICKKFNTGRSFFLIFRSLLKMLINFVSKKG